MPDGEAGVAQGKVDLGLPDQAVGIEVRHGQLGDGVSAIGRGLEVDEGHLLVGLNPDPLEISPS